MTIMTNFRAEDMPGNKKPVAPVKKPAPKPIVEVVPEETPAE